MALIVADLSIELIETLRPLMPRIKARDKNLEDLRCPEQRDFAARHPAHLVARETLSMSATRFTVKFDSLLERRC